MQLLVGMKILAAGAGYRSSILYEENPSIHSTGTYRIKFNTSPIDSDDFDDDGYWGRVNEKTVGRSNVLVYNLEVEDDHSYVAAGIAVHNCQSFSVAGKREGLAGASGLMFEYIRAVRELRPRWFVWENVPGAFTSERGEAYRQLLSEMDALGYGLAWRVLDAQPGIKQQTYICRADGQTNAMEGENLAPTLTSHAKKDPPLIYPVDESEEMKPVTLQIRGGKPGGGKGAPIQHDMSATLSTHNTQTLITGDHEERGLTVRRLTPRECERLQGFPDDYTDIPYRNKEHAPDGARYKALGNSMAVPVMRWIGERIRMVEETDETTE